MKQGWVYVLVNASMPGLVKVGQTAGAPCDRAAELSRPTGVAAPFVLVWEQEFPACVRAERDIHATLDRCGMRYARNREFFQGPIQDVIRIVLTYSQLWRGSVTSVGWQSGQELLAQGDRHLLGEDDCLQDVPEAVRCYQLAAQRGSVIACERLGATFWQSERELPTARQRALGYLREGLRRGNYYCYCEIAAIAAEQGLTTNFIKAWESFFHTRRIAYLSEAEMGKDRYVNALRRYVVTCFTLGLTPGYVDDMTAHAAELTQGLEALFTRGRHGCGARRDLKLPLAWAYRTLLGHAYPHDREGHAWLRRLRAALRLAPARDRMIVPSQ